MIFGSFRFRRAAIRYGRLLPPWLLKNYGRNAKYTVGQIQRAIEATRLDPKFAALPLAAYLPEAEFIAANPIIPSDLTYGSIRALYLGAIPVAMASTDADPPGVNAEVLRGGP